MWRLVFAIPLIMHGLANLAGVFAPWSKSLLGFSDSEWLLPGRVNLRSLMGKAWSLVWLASSICLVGAGVGLLLLQDWWLWAGVAGAALSLLSILPWWRAVPPGARFGAIFDLAVILVLLSPLGEQINPMAA
jgi:hypothetical protein